MPDGLSSVSLHLREPIVWDVLTPHQDLMQTQGAFLPPFSFGIFSNPLSTAEESMRRFLGNSQFSISFPADVTNCTLTKITGIDSQI